MPRKLWNPSAPEKWTGTVPFSDSTSTFGLKTLLGFVRPTTNAMTKATMRPVATPMRRSVKRTVIAVAAMNRNSVRPTCQACRNSLGCASRKPMTRSTPAKAASGIWLRRPGTASTNASRKKPWKKFDQRVFAPCKMFALLRTTSAIMGRPPMPLESAFPTPLPSNSLFMFDCRLYGSILSTASAVSSDSRLATKTKRRIHLMEVAVYICEKSGNASPPSSPPSGSGTRNCVPVS